MYCIDIHSIASYSIFTVSVFVSLFFPFAILSVDIFLFDVFQPFLRHFYLSIFSFSTFSVNSVVFIFYLYMSYNCCLCDTETRKKSLRSLSCSSKSNCELNPTTLHNTIALITCHRILRFSQLWSKGKMSKRNNVEK